jgi:hypothetical protein
MAGADRQGHPNADTYEAAASLARTAHQRADERYEASLSPEQRELYRLMSEANAAWWLAEHAMHIRQLARHFPGMEAAILAVADHLTYDYDPPCRACVEGRQAPIEGPGRNVTLERIHAALFPEVPEH